MCVRRMVGHFGPRTSKYNTANRDLFFLFFFHRFRLISIHQQLRKKVTMGSTQLTEFYCVFIGLYGTVLNLKKKIKLGRKWSLELRNSVNTHN